MLPSFPALRRKNLATLYGGGGTDSSRDRSPKGSVDARIQDLVDCINQHPDYVTLSSCSGRFAVFDPGAATHDHDGDYDAAGEVDHNGKGGTGNWLFVSHDLVDTDESRSALLQATARYARTTTRNVPTSANCCCLYVEPFLLHVAASHLAAGQRLWQAARQAGCRESGLGVTEARVTVAIRTQRGRLVVPIMPGGTSAWSEDSSAYTQFVIDQGNERMRQNWRMLRKLHGCIEASLFPDRTMVVQPTASVWRNVQLVRAAGAVLVKEPTTTKTHHSSSSSMDTSFQCILLGGYGIGPQAVGPQRRSQAVHVLAATANNSSSDDDATSRDATWETTQPLQDLSVAATESIISTSHGPLRVRSVPWTPRVGATAVPFGVSGDLVLVVGGHNGPAHPAEPVVVIYDAQHHTAYTMMGTDNKKSAEAVVETIGEDDDPRSLSPRWGHTCTPLPQGDNDQLAASWLCVGGRNTTQILQEDSVVLLQLETETTTGQAYLSYQRRRPYPIFDHAAVALPVPDTTTSHVLVNGGLVSVDRLTPPVVTTVLLDTTSSSAYPQPVDVSSGSDQSFHVFGHQLNRIPQRTSIVHWILMTGGVKDCAANPSSAICFCVDLVTTPARPKVVHVPFRLEEGTDKTTQSSALKSVLVHHCALSLPTSCDSRSRIALVGGGAAGFAFGHSYAPSRLLDVQIQLTTSTTEPAAASAASTKIKNDDTSADAASIPTPIPVVYVKRRDAKYVKDTLKEASLLDLQHRITTADPNGNTKMITAPSEDDADDSKPDRAQYVAIPVLDHDKVSSTINGDGCDNEQQHQLGSVVVGFGRQVCPFSTRRFAAASAGTN